ncbi:hypothetical protein SDC9_187323 [bioreactor metagenome]|uniref:Uncharacterized protein n=1 Tax=bioreactor metagenome TaxID=1076179 RepID=A0A645HLB6_9ZZZZ
MPFAEGGQRERLAADSLCDDLGGLHRSPEVAAEDMVERFAAQTFSRALRLLNAEGVQLSVRVSLKVS